MNKTFIVLRGLPGAGKSTFASFISGMCDTEVFTTDDYWEKMNIPFNKADLAVAHKWNREWTFAAMEKGVPVVILANTATEEWEFLDYILFAEKHGYKVFSLVVENRHGNCSVQDIPLAVRNKMEARFELSLGY